MSYILDLLKDFSIDNQEKAEDSSGNHQFIRHNLIMYLSIKQLTIF